MKALHDFTTVLRRGGHLTARWREVICFLFLDMIPVPRSLHAAYMHPP